MIVMITKVEAAFLAMVAYGYFGLSMQEKEIIDYYLGEEYVSI